MNTEFEILIILFIHWVADFLLQSEYIARNKSKDIYALTIHILIYSVCWLLVGVFFFTLKSVIVFTIITFISHFVTDFVISRWTSKLYSKGKFYGFPGFFPVIGLDQLLHYIQLILCYKYILVIL